MAVLGSSPDDEERLRSFFRLALGSTPGYACLAFMDENRTRFEERFYPWPETIEDMLSDIRNKLRGHNIYFCPQLFRTTKREKQHVKTCPSAWADLDTCTPEQLIVQPSVLIESSPGRFQALWFFEEAMSPQEAEDMSKRIAYKHAPQGADRSGWDLTQLLRVPFTYNYKYANGADTPFVDLLRAKRSLYRTSEFDAYPEVVAVPHLELPAPEDLPTQSGIEIIRAHRRTLDGRAFQLFQDEPEGSWSEPLWQLLMVCFEGGLSKEEAFVIARDAACNKYARDHRPEAQLWRDVARAWMKHQRDINATIIPEQELAALLTDEERELLRGQETFVERYIRWASRLGDAAPQYHQAGAFIILSALLAGKVFLPTSFGNVIPNLWFMILADTTLTRKSTAMDIAIDLLIEVDPDGVMATDGSLEGLMQGLSLRPGRASIFLRDEFSGLLEAMTKKDYMAGMAETLTKLYDGKYMKRILRKEAIEVKDPVLIVFAGGIKTRIQSLLTLDWVSSGFMPRFIFLTAESDVTKVQPLGPPKTVDIEGKDELLEEMSDLHERFSGVETILIPRTGKHIEQPKKWPAYLSEDAWSRFNVFEKQMLVCGMESERPDLMTPVFDRLGKSTLKAAVLLAATDCEGDEVVVQAHHLLQAIAYCEKWREYAIDVINGVGQSVVERDLSRVLRTISQRPGISRSQLMQNYHLTAVQADAIFNTLEQRGLVVKTRYGKTWTYSPVGPAAEKT